jgi:hypothetical protein
MLLRVWGIFGKLQTVENLKINKDQTHISQDLIKIFKNTSLVIYLKMIGQNVDLLV